MPPIPPGKPHADAPVPMRGPIPQDKSSAGTRPVSPVPNLRSKRSQDELQGAAGAAAQARPGAILTAAAPAAPAKRRKSETKEEAAQQGLARVMDNAACRAHFERAVRHGIPDLFIESKEHGQVSIEYGMDVINGCNRDRALTMQHQPTHGPTQWGRMYVVLPDEKKLDVLTDFTVVLKNPAALTLVSGCSAIGDLTAHDAPLGAAAYAAAARMDLLFRYGLVGCKIHSALAAKMQALIPGEHRADAYSFALQDAVLHRGLDLVRYCLQQGAKPISPEEPHHDYRSDAPIELAFAQQDRACIELLMPHLDSQRDAPKLRELFEDRSRWQTPPPEISKLLESA